MTEPFTIRRLGPADTAAYRTIRLAALEHAPDAFGSVFAVEAAQPLAAFTARLTTLAVFGAFVDAGIAGLVGFQPESGPRRAHKGVLSSFYVDPAWRGRGMAAALLSAAIEHARGVVEQVTLTVVRDNVAAVGFYERHGFETYGIEPRSLKTATGYLDQVLMIRWLTPR